MLPSSFVLNRSFAEFCSIVVVLRFLASCQPMGYSQLLEVPHTPWLMAHSPSSKPVSDGQVLLILHTFFTFPPLHLPSASKLLRVYVVGLESSR